MLGAESEEKAAERAAHRNSQIYEASGANKLMESELLRLRGESLAGETDPAVQLLISLTPSSTQRTKRMICPSPFAVPRRRRALPMTPRQRAPALRSHATRVPSRLPRRRNQQASPPHHAPAPRSGSKRLCPSSRGISLSSYPLPARKSHSYTRGSHLPLCCAC